MNKFSDIFEKDIDVLISDLLGVVAPGSSSSIEKSEYYQLPVKHTRDGKLIDKENKPWIVGTFLPKQYINPTHPEGHDGLDLKAPRGSPVYSIASGEVVEVKTSSKGGLTIKISHEEGNVVSYYAHLDSTAVQIGQKVDQNMVIGKVGDSGNAKGRGPHLHLEIKFNNKKIDPQSIFGKKVGTITKKSQFIKNIIKKLNESNF